MSDSDKQPVGSAPEDPDARPLRGLEGWKEETREHWRKYRPKMYGALEKSGDLDRLLNSAVNRTWDAMDRMIQQGVPYDAAWEQLRCEWMLLPSEEDMPRLGESVPEDEDDGDWDFVTE